MYASEIRELSREEIEQKILEAQQELFNLRFQESTQQIKDTNRIKTVKREIARLKTINLEKTRQQ
ncbi:MAG: 50S ribosomal protein L29 [Anaerolineae bacterium]